jgi:hypothetical protein
MESTNNSAYTKRPLWQWIVIYVIIGGLVYGVAYYLFIAKSGTYNTSSYQTPTNPTSVSQQKFLDSAQAKYSFQIFPGPLSTEAKNATAGFNIQTQTLPDGSTQVNLTSTNSEYQNQQYKVLPGYTLYFIERSLVDDSSTNNAEKNLGDDSAVLVDTQGFIVQP